MDPETLYRALYGQYDDDVVHDLLVYYLEHADRVRDPVRWGRYLAARRQRAPTTMGWTNVGVIADSPSQADRAIARQALDRLHLCEWPMLVDTPIVDSAAYERQRRLRRSVKGRIMTRTLDQRIDALEHQLAHLGAFMRVALARVGPIRLTWDELHAVTAGYHFEADDHGVVLRLTEGPP